MVCIRRYLFIYLFMSVGGAGYYVCFKRSCSTRYYGQPPKRKRGNFKKYFHQSSATISQANSQQANSQLLPSCLYRSMQGVSSRTPGLQKFIIENPQDTYLRNLYREKEQPTVSCFSSQFTFLPLGGKSACSEKMTATVQMLFCVFEYYTSLWLLRNVHFVQSTQRTRLQTRPFGRGINDLLKLGVCLCFLRPTCVYSTSWNAFVLTWERTDYSFLNATSTSNVIYANAT